jgi:hypothetical protein
LIKEGRVQPAGTEAFKKRIAEKAGVYSFEKVAHKLAPAFEKSLKPINKKAWTHFISKAPWYQRTSIHWAMSAKQEATRLKRLKTLITDSENEKNIAPLTRPTKK